MSGARPRSVLILVAALLVLASSFGCATVTALRIPGPSKDEAIAIDMHRSEVETILRYAKRSEFDESGGKTVRYEYGSGPHSASKARIVLYLAGDVFTLFLSELIFWPIEAYASGRADRVATAYYDSENILEMWTIARPGGDVLVTMGQRPSHKDVVGEGDGVDPGVPPVGTGPAGEEAVEKIEGDESQAREEVDSAAEPDPAPSVEAAGGGAVAEVGDGSE